jgi:hypothetical protein
MKTQRATIKDDHQLQGTMSIPWSEGPLGSMYPTALCSEIVGPKSNPAIAERENSTPQAGAPAENTAVSISASNSNIPTHEYAASAISGGSNSMLNTVMHIGAIVQSSQENSLKGRVQLYLVCQVHITHTEM